MKEQAIVVTMVPVTPQIDRTYENLAVGTCLARPGGDVYMVTDIEYKKRDSSVDVIEGLIKKCEEMNGGKEKGTEVSLPSGTPGWTVKILNANKKTINVNGQDLPHGFTYHKDGDGKVTITPPDGELIDGKTEESITPEEHETLLNNAQDCLVTAASPFWQTQKPLPSLRWVERWVPIDKHREKATCDKVLQQLHQIEGNDGNGAYCREAWIDVPVEKEEA